MILIVHLIHVEHNYQKNVCTFSKKKATVEASIWAVWLEHRMKVGNPNELIKSSIKSAISLIMTLCESFVTDQGEDSFETNWIQWQAVDIVPMSFW